MMNILIIGAKGFVGKNLCVKIGENKEFNIISFSRSETLEQFESSIQNSDFIIHLASEIRPKQSSNFLETIELTSNLCAFIKNNNKKIPIIFLSSHQCLEDSPEESYPRMKWECENLLSELSKELGNPLTIFRPPGIFGKWSRPNYNSVVATFCHNIANGLPIQIHEPDKLIKLVYIDDLVKQILSNIGFVNSGIIYVKTTPVHSICVKDLASLIFSFEQGRQNLYVENVGTGFTRKLYSTYLSYLQKEKFSHSIPQYKDERGNFSEIIKTQNAGQFSFFNCKPGMTRGQHYHHTKSEKFLVVSGKARFRFRHIITNETYEIVTSHRSPRIVNTIPGWAHEVTNIGDIELLTIIWANEVFDRNNPDTVASEV